MILDVEVGADGRVADVAVVEVRGSARVGFQEEAIRVTRLALFAPATVDGEPVAARWRAEVGFTIR